MSPQNACVDVLTIQYLYVTIFGERVFKEVNMVKCGHWGGPYRNRVGHTQRKDHKKTHRIL